MNIIIVTGNLRLYVLFGLYAGALGRQDKPEQIHLLTRKNTTFSSEKKEIALR